MEELAQIAALENLKRAEILANQPLRKYIRRGDPFQTLNNRMFVKLFRFTKNLARQLIELLSDYLQLPSRKSALDKQTEVLVALELFGHGSYQTNIGYNIFCGVSQSSVSRCIAEVTDSLNEPAVFNSWIHFPRARQELEDTRRRFYDKYGLPGMIGCIDCTHVAIFPPRQNDDAYPGHIYVNRKNYHSINLQLAINACAVLHNMCLHANMPDLDEEPGDEELDFGIFREAIQEPNYGT